MRKFSRRQLFRWFVTGIVAPLALACRRASSMLEGAPNSASPQTGSQPSPKILRNMNRPRYNVRFIQPTRALDHDQWRLSIEGIVKGPQSLTFQEMIESLPAVKQNSRMVCVEGWSFRAEWEGFTMQALLELVEPEPEARYVHFHCVDGYYEVLSIEELLEPRVLFAYKMDGEYLSDEHGWPLRVILPPRYGYKGPKSITKIAFSPTGGKGYWSTVGPYTVDGHIQPGLDRPQDLPGEVRRTVEGEQTY